jgi:sec-independent protein translocase protein TatB
VFSLSFPELALIALVALLVLGPQRLPGAARTAGALLRKARASWASVRNDIERELAAEDVKRSLKQAADSVREAGARIDGGVKAVSGDLAAAAQEAARALPSEPAAGGARPDEPDKPA